MKTRFKPPSQYSRGELAKAILLGLAVGGLIVAVLALPGLAQILALFQPKSRKERYRIRRTIRALEERGLVLAERKDNREIIRITEKGKTKALEYSFDDIKLKHPQKWDGFWRVIIFDIPNTKDKIRRLLNFKLKDLRLYPLQKSTFITPYECKKEIDFIAEFLFIRKYITYMKVAEIDGENELKKKFRLV